MNEDIIQNIQRNGFFIFTTKKKFKTLNKISVRMVFLILLRNIPVLLAVSILVFIIFDDIIRNSRSFDDTMFILKAASISVFLIFAILSRFGTFTKFSHMIGAIVATLILVLDILKNESFYHMQQILSGVLILYSIIRLKI